MSEHTDAFFALAARCGVLRFGEFQLKSGRTSPYFFNAGLFNSGAAIDALGAHYARALLDSGLAADTLFGPAYKGIPLVTATAAALARAGRDLPWAFNRKESKDHGEGGTLVGAPLRGDVLVVDDVITAGTAVRESRAIIEGAGARLGGVLLALDRQERGSGARSAVQELRDDWGVPVIAIAALNDLIAWLRRDAADPTQLVRLQRYRDRYGVDD